MSIGSTSTAPLVDRNRTCPEALEPRERHRNWVDDHRIWPEALERIWPWALEPRGTATGSVSATGPGSMSATGPGRLSPEKSPRR